MSDFKKTESEWLQQLGEEKFSVLRKKGTEKPFSGIYNSHFEKGNYYCAGCHNLLFKSDSKFDSGCGWPSFDDCIEGSIAYQKDTSFGMMRIEILCARCDGHLGHVFDDGPTGTGKRYCVNSLSIDFENEN